VSGADSVRSGGLLSQRPTDQQESPGRSPPITAGPCSSSLAQRYPTQLSQAKIFLLCTDPIIPVCVSCNSIPPALLLACAACCEASSSFSGPCPLYSYSLHLLWLPPGFSGQQVACCNRELLPQSVQLSESQPVPLRSTTAVHTRQRAVRKRSLSEMP
jgi:hypothetical protein